MRRGAARRRACGSPVARPVCQGRRRRRRHRGRDRRRSGRRGCGVVRPPRLRPVLGGCAVARGAGPRVSQGGKIVGRWELLC